VKRRARARRGDKPRTLRVLRGCLALTAFLVAGLARPAAAQDERIGVFVVDVRGAVPRLGQSPDVAAGLNVPVAALPSWGLGVDVDAHVYPLRTRLITFGLGGSFLLARGRQTPDPEVDLPEVETTFTAVSPQISLNFGHRQGWSYLSGGIGTSRYENAVGEGGVAPDVPRAKTINYGGGARWFTNDHMAIAIDLRFYAINPQEAAPPVPARPRMTLMVLSVGLGFR
jgi:hypothetical protein